jgi:outer membrane protein TolC
MTQPLLDGAGTGVNLVGLRQARNKAAQTEHSFRASVLDVTRQVEVGYWELVLANQLTQIREFAVGLADEQLKRNEERFRVGKAIRAMSWPRKRNALPARRTSPMRRPPFAQETSQSSAL